MKDGKFETQAEIFQALLDGKKVIHVVWGKGEYVFLNNSKTLKRENGDDALSSFPMPTNWSIYEEPKPKKKVTLYRYTYKYGSVIHQTNFTSKNWSAFGENEDYLLLTESKEIEVDDV